MKRDNLPLPAPPVQESELKKKSGTYNAYTLALSWGQLQVLVAALERDHADPVSDELLAELKWMLENAVPGPGESEEDMKAREEEQASVAELANAENAEDFPLPMPPGAEGGDLPIGDDGTDDLDAPPSGSEEDDGPTAEEDAAPPTEVDTEELAVAESVSKTADKWLSSPPR